MKLSEIYPKANLTIYCDNQVMSTLTNGRDIIVIYMSGMNVPRYTIWKDKSLLEFLKNEFLKPNNVKEVVDWNTSEHRGIYLYKKCRDCKQLTKEEICKLLNEDLIEIIDN